jgi:membrane-associated phospholipid phosphatase
MNGRAGYIIKDNPWYFSLLFFCFAIAVILLMTLRKEDAILFFSEHRTALANSFFRIVTRFGEALVYYVIVLILLFYRIRTSLVVAATGLIVIPVSYFSKMFFAVDRPITWFREMNMADQLNLIDGVQLYTGATSFPSGHTMSAFALYSILAFLLRNNNNKSIFTTLLFLVAFLVAISRIYLIQHFLADVTAGALVGVSIAIGVFLFQNKYTYQPERRIDQPLFFTRRLNQNSNND